jgi:hypothetical protein
MMGGHRQGRYGTSFATPGFLSSPFSASWRAKQAAFFEIIFLTAALLFLLLSQS